MLFSDTNYTLWFFQSFYTSFFLLAFFLQVINTVVALVADLVKCKYYIWLFLQLDVNFPITSGRSHLQSVSDGAIVKLTPTQIIFLLNEEH